MHFLRVSFLLHERQYPADRKTILAAGRRGTGGRPGRTWREYLGTAAGSQERGRGTGAAAVVAEEEKRQQMWVMFGGDGVINVVTDHWLWCHGWGFGYWLTDWMGASVVHGDGEHLKGQLWWEVSQAGLRLDMPSLKWSSWGIKYRGEVWRVVSQAVSSALLFWTLRSGSKYSSVGSGNQCLIPAWHQWGVLQFNPSLALSTLRQHLVPQVESSVPQDCPSLLMPAFHPCFWLPGYKSEVPVTSSLGSIHLLEWLIYLRKPAYSLDYWFTTKENKGYKSTNRWSAA